MKERATGECDRTGRWQVALLALVGCNYTIVSINHVLPAFHAFTPSYYCQVEEGENVTRVDGCLVDQDCESGYQFESVRGDSTIVTEWGLVCDRRLLKPLIATLYYCGVMVGAPLGGMMTDKYGRRVVMLVCLYCQGTLGLVLYAANTLTLFTALRSIQGVFVQSLQGSTYTLLMELFPPKTRTAVGIVLEIYWAIGLCVLAGCSYLIADWRNLQLALTVPTLLTIPYACFVPESPRWLATRGRHVEAEQTLRKIARRNGFTKRKEDLKKEQHKNGSISILPESTQSSFEMNCLSNINQQPSSTKICETDAVVVGYKAKDSAIHSSVSMTSNCFKDLLSESKTNLTAEEILPSCEPDINRSPDAKRVSCNGSAGVPTKQDLLPTCELDFNPLPDAKRASCNGSTGVPTKQDLLPTCELDFNPSPDAKRVSCNGSAGVPTKQDHLTTCELDFNPSPDAKRVSCNGSAGVPTKQDLLPTCELDFNPSPDAKRASCNGSAGMPTKQDAVSVFSVANGIGQDMKVETVAVTDKKAGVLELFRNSLMRKYSSVMIYVWFSVSLCYYGIIFYLPDLSGDRHLNFFIGAILEVASYCIAYFVLSRLGRRYPLAVYLLLSGLLCAVVGIMSSLETSLSTLQTVLALLGKAVVVSSFCTIFIYTTELFPTVVRAAAFGCCAFGGRVGNLVAPQLLLLGELTTNVVPLVSMGALAIMAGVVTLLLPETLDRPLADTVKQEEDMDTTRKTVGKAPTFVDQQC